MPVFPVLGQIGVKLEENGRSWAPCGRGGRIATASLRTGLAMTGYGPCPKGTCCAASGTPPLQGKANGGVSSYTASPARGRLVVTFFYKPIDIVGFMCYHALTYKKDMLKE